jgi:hypothetical protein
MTHVVSYVALWYQFSLKSLLVACYKTIQDEFYYFILIKVCDMLLSHIKKWKMKEKNG